MTWKSSLVWIGGVTVLAMLLAFGLWSLSPGPTWSNFQRLRVGMTEAEVEAIMGPPTEDMEAAAVPIPHTHQGLADYMRQRRDWEQKTSRLKRWYAKERYIFNVHFDKDGRLRDTLCRDLHKEAGW